MTDTEIDRRLALAIGYRPEDVLDLGDSGRITVWRADRWRVFSHKEWETIGPIAERYNLFPVRPNWGKRWCIYRQHVNGNYLLVEDAATPQQCIALAAIAKLEKS